MSFIAFLCKVQGKHAQTGACLLAQLGLSTTALPELGARLADLCSSGHLDYGEVGTLAFIQYTCLFNPHLTIRLTRKGPDGLGNE